MKLLIKTLGCLALVALVAGCGSGGGDAKAELKTPMADIKTEAAAADEGALEAKVASYQDFIKDHQSQIDELKKKATDALKDTGIGDLLSEDVQKAKDMADNYTVQADNLMKDLKAAQERLAVYVEELKQKAGGA